MRKQILLATTSLALVMLTGNAGAQTGPVRVGLDVDAGTLDPRLARDTSAYRVTDLVYDGLVRLSADLKPEPILPKAGRIPIRRHGFSSSAMASPSMTARRSRRMMSFSPISRFSSRR